MNLYAWPLVGELLERIRRHGLAGIDVAFCVTSEQALMLQTPHQAHFLALPTARGSGRKSLSYCPSTVHAMLPAMIIID